MMPGFGYRFGYGPGRAGQRAAGGGAPAPTPTPSAWPAYVDEPTELAALDASLASIYPKLDAFYLLAGATRAASKVNRANPGTYDLTEVGTAPLHTAGQGFRSAGSGSYLQTGIDLSVAGKKAVQNDHSLGLWHFNNLASNALCFGYGPMQISPGVGTSQPSTTRMRSASTTNSTVTGMVDNRGLFALSRNNSANFQQYYGGELWDNTTQASASLSSPTNGGIRICGYSDGAASPSNVYDTTRTYSVAYIGGYLTQAEQKIIRDASGRYLTRMGGVMPYVKILVAGIPTPTGFTCTADFGNCYDPAQRARLVVTTAADTTFAAPVFTGSWEDVTFSDYHAWEKLTATGLTAATDYRVRVELETYSGALPDGGTQLLTGLLTTAPSGAAAFRFLPGSCFVRTSSSGTTVADLLRAQNADFMVSMGDDNYDDNIPSRTPYLALIAADPLETKRRHRWGFRGRQKWADRSALALTTPQFYIPDDHDFVSNDLRIGDTVSGSVLFEDINQDVRDAYLEASPHPTLIDSPNSLASKFDYGLCTFIAMDTASQRNETAGEMVNASQLTAIVAAINAAGAAGQKLVFLLSTNTWANAHEGWRASPGAFIAQHDSLNNSIKSALDAYSQLRVAVLVGDMHESAADDTATYTDFSSGGMSGKIAQFVCSPWNSTSLSSALTFTFNGVAAKHAVSNQMMAVVDVNAANDNFAISFYNNISGSSVLVATYDTADLVAW